ncbi:G5 domain-containing protein [Finegoldia magna]|uniref:G5 domain-containing protein n=1 Tax=Finegoldia magna TaxID=1260 RepID=UPI002902F97D|nr:G5 domain-containing protein [Finegoldia magna]MDU2500237.1 G5 domain-containing protein [Finegoldia magna]
MTLFDKENKGKAEEDQWKIDVKGNDISKFTITPPESAKAGDSTAVAVKYTYTNGSTDLYWFHFVVKESTYIKPEYEAQVNFPSRQQTSPATVKEDGKRIPPDHYTLPDTLETDGEGNKLITDDIGNKWAVSIDGKTGEVTAQPVKPEDFNGGEKLTVPVIAHYKDEQKPGEDITEDVDAYFVIKEKANMTVRYNAKAGKSGDVLTSDIILNEEDIYNRRPTKFTLDSDTFVDDKGNTWEVKIDEDTGKVTATVPEGDGDKIDGALLNVPVTAHYYEIEDGQEVPMGTRQTEVQFVASGTEDKVEKILDVPFETKVEKDSELKKGEIKVIQEGEKGSKKVTYTIKDSKITDTKEEELKAPQDRLIHVGEGTEDGEHKIEEKVEVPYEVEIQFDDTLKLGEQVVFQEGEPGEKTRTTTITIQDGNVTNTQVGEYTQTKAPKKKIIKVGANTEGKVEHVEPIPFKYDVQYDPDFYTKYPEATDNYKIVTEGEAGERTTTWTIKNSEIVGKPEVNVTKQPVDAVIKVGKKDYNGTFTTKETKAVEFDTEYRVNNELKPGEVKVVQKGELGEEQVTVTHTIENGKVINSEKGQPERTKEPVKRIVEVGPGTTDGTHTYTSKKPFEVEVRVNPELKKGEHKVVQKGVEGEEEYTITIENSKVTNTSEPRETKAPVKEIIEVGSEDYTGTVEYIDKDPIPFETEVTVDPSLKPGEVVEDQKGELGEQETKITRTIKNGEAGEENRGETTVTKEPVKRKIRVGSKTDGQYKETETIPFEVEVRKDPSLKKGEWKYAEIDGVQQTGESGLKERTITIVNSKVTEESEFKTTREPKKAIILVGEESTDGVVEHKEEIPFEYTVEYDPDFYTNYPDAKDNYKIVTEGVPGEKITKWTIKDSEVVGKPEENITKEPVNGVIKVGQKDLTGTFETKKTKAIEYETEYIEDETLEPGKTVVEQEGELGEEETKVTLTIENGKVIKTEEGTPVRTKEPVKKIVRVGKKPADPTEGETTKTIEREIPYETKVIYDDTLEAGFQKIEKEGKPGKEEVTITQKIKDSKPVGDPTETTKTITEKEDRVVRVGVKPVVKEVELGNDTEYRHNPELKEGETKVIEEGSKGSVKYTTTFNKETGKLEVTEERVEPTNKVVEYGSKTDGEFTYESEQAYDIIVRENPNLEAGKVNVIQEGIVGKTETTVKIENSKEVSRDTKTITEKQDKIIEIGTKNVCEIPPVDPDPEQPDGKDPKDPEQPGGKDPKDPETPGKEDPKNPEQPDGKDPENPDKPGDKDPENPDKPGDKDPETPGKPGDKDPGTPGKPGDKDPGTPGEDPKDPDKDPGKEDPKDPETPGGKDPKDPEQPGGEDPKDPEIPGKTPENNGKTPENNGKTPENNGKTPENNGKTPENNGKTPGATGQVDGKSTTTNNKTPKRLPKSGSESEIMTLAMSGLLTAAGFVGLKKKRKDK